MNSQEKKYYEPSPLVLMGKSVFFVMKKFLPRQISESFYNATFSAYRKLIRFLYLRFWIWAFLTGNDMNRHKVMTIFSVMPYSLVGWRGLEATFDVISYVIGHGIPGSIVECGVAQGGSAALMALEEARTGNHCKIWLFDSFEGLPEPTKDDYIQGATGNHVRPLPKGACLGTYEQVADLLFKRMRLNPDNILMIKGWFQDTLPLNRDRIGAIALLRIDADWYESVKCCLDNLYDDVIRDGFVIIDDYDSCYGARKAVDEFLKSRTLQVDLIHDGRGGCYFIKPK